MSDLEERVEQLEQEVDRIKQRNRKVERDKAWETSWSRRVLITVLTYLVIVVYFVSAGMQDPFTGAVVPAVAFVLATATLPWFKRLWLRQVHEHIHPLEEADTGAGE
ncbi:MAG: hypothetical protein SV186_01745 [Candidatus Nanohaloarchaea archaeon]|nr:hypothetical protein [Candidatus Nanohaloarchaea archaeon]